MEPVVEKATINDAKYIHKLINYFAAKNLMLPRPLAQIYENIRDYFVIRQNDKLVACAALHVNWGDLAEIKGLAVDDDKRGQKLGGLLVQACLDEGKRLGIETIFCLTYEVSFFERLGFTRVDKRELPHKVWGECQICPKFPDCDEVALIYKVNP